MGVCQGAVAHSSVLVETPFAGSHRDSRLCLMRQANERGSTMTVTVITRLDRKYMHRGTQMTDPYTEERDGHLYLVCDPTAYMRCAILCDAIVDVIA